MLSRNADEVRLQEYSIPDVKNIIYSTKPFCINMLSLFSIILLRMNILARTTWIWRMKTLNLRLKIAAVNTYVIKTH